MVPLWRIDCGGLDCDYRSGGEQKQRFGGEKGDKCSMVKQGEEKIRHPSEEPDCGEVMAK